MSNPAYEAWPPSAAAEPGLPGMTSEDFEWHRWYGTEFAGSHLDAWRLAVGALARRGRSLDCRLPSGREERQVLSTGLVALNPAASGSTEPGLPAVRVSVAPEDAPTVMEVLRAQEASGHMEDASRYQIRYDAIDSHAPRLLLAAWRVVPAPKAGETPSAEMEQYTESPTGTVLPVGQSERLTDSTWWVRPFAVFEGRDHAVLQRPAGVPRLHGGLELAKRRALDAKRLHQTIRQLLQTMDDTPALAA